MHLIRSAPLPLVVCNFTNIVRGPFQACTLGFSVAKAREGEGLMTTVVERGVEITSALRWGVAR